MPLFRTVLAASILSGGFALAIPDAQALPMRTLTPLTTNQNAIQHVYYRYYPVYGWRRPFYARPFYGYGWGRPYGWRTYGWRGYGPGYRRDWRNRRLLGSRAR